MILAPTPVNEIERLKDLCSYKLLDSCSEREFDDITELAAQICEVPTALISLVDENRQWFKSTVGFGEIETPRDISFCGHAILEPDIMVVQDTLTDPRFRDNPLVTNAPHIRFYAGAPIVSPLGHALGTLCVIDMQPRQLSAAQKKALTQLAQQVVSQMELKRTARSVANQNTFQQSILNSTDSLVMATNPDGVITHFNSAAQRMLEYSPDEVINRLTPLHFHEHNEIEAQKNTLRQKNEQASLNDHCALIGQAREGGIEHRIWTLIAKSGRKFEVELTVSPLQKADGEFIGYLHWAQNLSNTKKIQEALFLEKKRLQGVIEGTDAGTWEWSIPDNKVILNERWAQMMGFTLSELQPLDTKVWRQRIHPQDLPVAERHLEQHFSGLTEVFEHEFRLKHKDGHWLWVQSHGRVVSRHSDGTPLTMYGIHIDISERKKAEAALKNRKKELESLVDQRTSELASNVAFVNSLIESSPDCLKVLSTEAKLLYMTTQGCKIMEVDDFCDIEGADWVAFWDKSDQPTVRQALKAALNGQQGRFQAMTPTMKGREKWWDVMISPVINKNGQVDRLLSVSRDISHQKKLEEKLRIWNSDLEDKIEQRTSELADAREAAEAANHAKTTFLTNMSHEIRTPLNAIIGISELLEQSKSDKERDRLLKLTQESAHSLLEIISDILDLSKIEAGQLNVNMEPMSPHSAFLFASELFTQTAQAKGLYLRTEFDQRIPASVMCDPLRLRQILFNLLGNAVKFTHKGGIEFKAKLLDEHNDIRRIQIQVIDTGIGIRQSAQKKIFEPFAQATQDTTKKFGGTGLGLAICKRLAELLDGELHLESQLDSGSCMTVTLPLKETDENTLTSPRDTPGELAEYKQTVPDYVLNANILIADDNPTNRALLENQLRLIGCEKIAVACDGIEALSKWTSGHYDLVICDCQMPKMDGYDVAQHIREINTLHLNRHVAPFIGYTADALSETRTRCLNAGMDDVLIKPVGMATLKKTLTHWLDPSIKKIPELANLVSPVDWEALDESTGDNREFAKDLLLAFVADKGKQLRKLDGLIMQRDIQGVLHVMHKIKGSALGLCAKPLADTCHLIETAAQQGDSAILETGKELLEAEFARIKDLLEHC
jgi:PAS domain S-box-containing protein